MADLTSGIIPVATDTTQIDDTSVANPGTIGGQLTMSFASISALGAAVAVHGTGIIPGVTSLTVVGGTGTAPIFPVTATQAVSATVAAAGDGSGTPGSATVTTTTATGTQAQFTVTIDGGGLLASVDAVLVPGNITADFTDPTQEPVTGGDLVGAKLNIVEGVLALGTPSPTGPLTAIPSDPVVTTGGNDDVTINVGWGFAPAVVGSNSARGFAFDSAGAPGLALSGVIARMTSVGDAAEHLDGLIIESTSGFFGLTITPPIGFTGDAVINLSSYDDEGSNNNYPFFILNYAHGARGTPAIVKSGDVFGEIAFGGYAGSSWSSVARLTATAEEDFVTGISTNSKLAITTFGGGLPLERLVFDGSGNTNIENGHLNIASTAPMVASNAGTPTLDATASDTAGIVTVGAGSTSTTITFNAEFATAPHAVMSNPDGAIVGLSYTISTTEIVASYTINTGGTLAYIALG